MYNKELSKSRMCSKLFTLAGAALVVSVTALAQNGSMQQQPNSGAMNSAPNSTMNPATSGTMAGRNGSMAGQNGGMPMGGAGAASMQDKKFVKMATAGSLTEIQAAQVALQKSSSDDVKKFAQQMIDDHTKLNDQMKPIAAQIGVTLPTQPMPKDQAMIAKLQGMQGGSFDKAYIRDMVKDHSKDDKDFSMEASSGQFQPEKDAASQGDQVVKQHLQMAQDLAKAHNVTVGSKMSM